MSTTRKPWSREELLVLCNLYEKIDFGKFHSRNPVLIEVAQRMGRTPASISMKLGNLGSLDPRLYLGTTQDLFPGPIVGLGIRYADMHAYFYGTWLFPGKQGHVPGLTGPQLIGGISLSSDLLKLSGGSTTPERQ